MSLKSDLAHLKQELAKFKHSQTKVIPTKAEFAELLGLELDDWQANVLNSDSKRDLFNCTRQGGKSTTAGLLSLYEALYVPGSLTLLVSPSLRQSSELFRKVIDFKNALPFKPDLIEDNKLSLSVYGGGRVVSLPGSEATIRGYSAATLLIEDEAARVQDELHYSIKPMLATTGGRMILMSTPFGKRGHFWDTWDSGLWERTRVPATEIPRISPAFLESERQSMPLWWFEQEYMCEFKEATDSVFRYDDIMNALSDEIKPLFGADYV